MICLFCLPAAALAALSSANIPLDSPVYSYLDKLAGFGLLQSDIKGLKPFSKAEAVRLVLEAERNLAASKGADSVLALDLLAQLKTLLPREMGLYAAPEKARLFDATPLAYAQLRYVWLDGVPRDYNRTVLDHGHQSAFGFIGGDLRPFSTTSHTTGSEGTPLLENNEGVVYRQGSSGEFRLGSEGYLSQYATLALEPLFLATAGKAEVSLQKAYLKIGGAGAELEVGRDANWFGPGYRGTTMLTNNARNFDQVKFSSPEPLDFSWVKRWVGNVKYSLFFSRFDETGAGTADRRQPWMVGAKLAVKPREWYEVGVNFVRQFGGPGFSGSSDTIFGGGMNDHSNSIAGFDARFRIPGLRNTELYGEFSGEDNAGGVWPIVESYVAGIFVPRLTASGRDDLRFEYFRGSVMLYSDWQFPAGYVYHGLTPGHSQGTAAQDFFVRYSHWFSAQNNLALEYIHTERGREGRLPGQALELKDGGRLSWRFPVAHDFEAALMYGAEWIENLNLVAGASRMNQLGKIDFSYRY